MRRVDEERAEIEAQIADYLKRGKKIQKIPIGQSGDDFNVRRTHKQVVNDIRRKSAQARGLD